MDEQRLPVPLPPGGQILIYRDGATNLQVRLDGQTVWLTQAAMAELYQTTKQNISLHIQNIIDEKELQPEAVVKEYLTTAADGKRYRTLHYSLDMILAVGYRVRSPHGTLFRQWANTAFGGKGRKRPCKVRNAPPCRVAQKLLLKFASCAGSMAIRTGTSQGGSGEGRRGKLEERPCC